jgi:hypothetical protein
MYVWQRHRTKQQRWNNLQQLPGAAQSSEPLPLQPVQQQLLLWLQDSALSRGAEL